MQNQYYRFDGLAGGGDTSKIISLKNHKIAVYYPKETADARFFYISTKYDNKRLQIRLPVMIQYDMTSRLALSFWRDAPKQAKSDDLGGFRQNPPLSHTAAPRWVTRSSQVMTFVGIHVSTQG